MDIDTFLFIKINDKYAKIFSILTTLIIDSYTCLLLQFCSAPFMVTWCHVFRTLLSVSFCLSARD